MLRSKFKNKISFSAVAVLFCGVAFLQPAHAANRTLILTANDVPLDLGDALTELGYPASADRLDTLENANAISQAQFFNSDGEPYERVVVLTGVKQIHPSNFPVLQDAINQRWANMFNLFVDSCDSCPGGNLNGILDILNTLTGASMSMSGAVIWSAYGARLNTAPAYSGSFSGLDPLYAGWLRPIDNVPVGNILYLKRGATAAPATGVDSATAVFLPATAANACVLAVPDLSVFHYYATFTQLPLNQGRIGPALNAAAKSPDHCAYPHVKKAFAPATVALGASSTLTITLTNPRTDVAANTQVTDNLPAPLAVAGPATTTCTGGMLTAAMGGSQVQYSGGQIPAATAGVSGTCTITVPVRWTNNAAGAAACHHPVQRVATNSLTPPTGFSTGLSQIGLPASAELTCDAALPPVAAPAPAPVPALQGWALGLLATCLGALGLRQRRRCQA